MSELAIAIHEGAQAVHFMHLSYAFICLIMLWAFSTVDLTGGANE
tara:strand:- start:2304 stop:2438 length:135 start_codon:yes stop_codon:yes gene_type:complete